MNKVIDRSMQPISLQPMFDVKGILMTVHGDHPTENTVVALSLKEARILTYGLLAEGERQA